MAGSVLLYDNPPLAAALREGSPGCAVHQLGTFEEIGRCLREPPPEGWTAVFVPAEGREQLRALEALRKGDAHVPIVAVAARGDVPTASAAVGAGAQDLLVLGEDLVGRVQTVLGKLRPVTRLRTENARLRERSLDWSLTGSTPQIEAVRQKIRLVAAVPRPVLILGERGTGKELVARAVHEAAGAPGRPLVTVNCAAFSDPLLESELFGHERGAFTGAERRTSGRFEQAAGGTLFLDEIGATTIAFQQKVLRAVEYGEYRRVGGAEDLRSTARIIAATNADLDAAIRDGRFLPDLYDRLAFEVIRVPPLRERLQDVERLATLFLERFAREVPALANKHLAPDAVAALQGYAYPGNVRELKHLVERAAYRQPGDEICAEDLDLHAPPEGRQVGFEAAVDQFQRMLLHDALARAGGNQAEAARALGMSYHSFRYYWKRLG